MRIVDIGTGGYATDYTGHAFLESYFYEHQQFVLNNSFEYASFWKRPPPPPPPPSVGGGDHVVPPVGPPPPLLPYNKRILLSPADPLQRQTEQKIDFVYTQGQQNAYHAYKPELSVEYVQQDGDSGHEQQQYHPHHIGIGQGRLIFGFYYDRLLIELFYRNGFQTFGSNWQILSMQKSKDCLIILI